MKLPLGKLAIYRALYRFLFFVRDGSFCFFFVSKITQQTLSRAENYNMQTKLFLTSNALVSY